jgi:rhodanese-related sulfurtransferase
MLPGPEEFEIMPAGLVSLNHSPDSSHYRLIDCREEEEFEICRIEGAELFPLSRFLADAPGNLLSADDDRPLVVYCHHGIRSMNATLYLREQGKENVWSLVGGIDLWSRQIDPSVPRY